MTDKIKHKAEEIAGEAKSRVGAASADLEYEAEGERQKSDAQIKQELAEAEEAQEEQQD